VLLFRYAFSGAIHVPGVNDVDYLMPGVFAQSVAFGAIGTAMISQLTCGPGSWSGSGLWMCWSLSR
jgi:hypothetical protein